MININEQINQNLTSGNKAFYGAAPQGNGSAGIKFTAKTYGVVMDSDYKCFVALLTYDGENIVCGETWRRVAVSSVSG